MPQSLHALHALHLQTASKAHLAIQTASKAHLATWDCTTLSKLDRSEHCISDRALPPSSCVELHIVHTDQDFETAMQASEQVAPYWLPHVHVHVHVCTCLFLGALPYC